MNVVALYYWREIGKREMERRNFAKIIGKESIKCVI